jgi:hypothetical protein
MLAGIAGCLYWLASMDMPSSYPEKMARSAIWLSWQALLVLLAGNAVYAG